MNKKIVPMAAFLSASEMAGFESWISVVRAYVLCEKAMTVALGPLGVSIAQHDILANLLRDPGITQTRLAERLLVTRSNVSMLLTQMAKHGLLERRPNPADARANRLYLTAKGDALVQRSLAAQAGVVSLMLREANRAERTTIAAVMTRISAALQQDLDRETVPPG